MKLILVIDFRFSQWGTIEMPRFPKFLDSHVRIGYTSSSPLRVLFLSVINLHRILAFFIFALCQ